MASDVSSRFVLDLIRDRVRSSLTAMTTAATEQQINSKITTPTPRDIMAALLPAYHWQHASSALPNIAISAAWRTAMQTSYSVPNLFVEYTRSIIRELRIQPTIIVHYTLLALMTYDETNALIH
jgi:hypothetical protein